jgi:hypothetical protein
MKQISNKEYEKYQQYQTDKLYGRILTPDGLRVVCAGLDNDPEKIGIHMLEMTTTHCVPTRRWTMPHRKRRTGAALEQPTPPALTVRRWPVEKSLARVQRSQDQVSAPRRAGSVTGHHRPVKATC